MTPPSTPCCPLELEQLHNQSIHLQGSTLVLGLRCLCCRLTCGEAPWTAVRTGGLCPLLGKMVEGDNAILHFRCRDSPGRVGTSSPLESICGKAVKGRLWLGYPHLCSDPGFTKVWVPTLSCPPDGQQRREASSLLTSALGLLPCTS